MKDPQLFKGDLIEINLEKVESLITVINKEVKILFLNKNTNKSVVAIIHSVTPIQNVNTNMFGINFRKELNKIKLYKPALANSSDILNSQKRKRTNIEIIIIDNSEFSEDDVKLLPKLSGEIIEFDIISPINFKNENLTATRFIEYIDFRNDIIEFEKYSNIGMKNLLSKLDITVCRHNIRKIS